MNITGSTNSGIGFQATNATTTDYVKLFNDSNSHLESYGGTLWLNQLTNQPITTGTGLFTLSGPTTVAGTLTGNGLITTSNLVKAGAFQFTGGIYSGAGCIYSDSNWGCYILGAQVAAIADFSFRNSAGTERFRIDNAGMVFSITPYQCPMPRSR